MPASSNAAGLTCWRAGPGSASFFQWPQEELDAYINTYLKEEIKGEALVQNFVNFANIASDSGIPASSVRAYFEILADTFTGFLLEPWRQTRKRKAVASAKFYFFDIGVANFLSGTSLLNANSSEFGKAFEHFITMELRSWLSHWRIKKELCYWRTVSGAEVDFVIGDTLAIEAKATTTVSDKHLKGLRLLAEENMVRQFILVSFDEINRQTADGIQVLHWQHFLDKLWSGQITPD